MASYSMEEFVGDGVLKDLLPMLIADGWDDVPTLKMMNSEDMDSMKMSQRQKDALELRSYLHDRSLMQYGERLEASGLALPKLLNSSTTVLSSQFGMKRGHITRFIDRSLACGIAMPPSSALPLRKRTTSSLSKNVDASEAMSSNFPGRTQSTVSMNQDSKSQYTVSASFGVKGERTFKGVVAFAPAEPRCCGLVQPPPELDNVAPYSMLESISIQKLTPEYKMGMEPLVKLKAPPMKASELWHDIPTVLLCLRRPGCVMCRAEAHQLYARKPIFDALGFRLIAAFHEQIDSEVSNFWPRYWGGIVVLDKSMGFFKALGGGKLLKDQFVTGFLCNPRAIANYRRAKAMGVENNFNGKGEIKGGLFIIDSGKSGIAYQFMERNFGDWAPINEVLEICSRMQKQASDQEAGP
ncbi:hypothetical protein AMTRI_Chr10g6950 [Amborella trichopoda]